MSDESCAMHTCVPVACTNGVKDGMETAADCGGPMCLPCDDGKACSMNSDCSSGYCKSGLCFPASCNDSVQDGNETDQDCGGSCTTKCADGKKCAGNGDCLHNNCAGGTCISCVDGLLNGDETDTDCGGSCSTKCGFAKMCKHDMECASGFCINGVCDAFTIVTSTFTNPGTPKSLAIDATSVYWASDTSIGSALLAGGTPTYPSGSTDEVRGLAIGGGFVFWTQSDTVYRSSISVAPLRQSHRASSPHGASRPSTEASFTGWTTRKVACGGRKATGRI